MKKIELFLIFIFTLTIFSCDKDAMNESSGISNTPLVINVYDFNYDLVAHYEYNENEQLIKREFTDPTTGLSSDLIFHYKNNLVQIIEYVDHDFQFSHETYYYYNRANKIIKIETHKEGQIIGTFHLNYSSQGQVVSFNTTGKEPTTFYEYNSNGNIIKTTNHLTDPWNGQESTQGCEFVYDTKKKVYFGLDYLIGIDLLPWRGNTSNWEQSLSKNNIISESCSGHEYMIEYDTNDNPVSITTTWKDIETETPMTIRIEYKNE
jgi:YD repeat-containing protein